MQFIKSNKRKRKQTGCNDDTDGTDAGTVMVMQTVQMKEQ